MKMYICTTREQFIEELEAFKQSRPHLTSNVGEVPDNGKYRLVVVDDIISGYVVTWKGELRCVFSCGKGQGDALIRNAIANGAKYLDCFDGYLPEFYKRHGFVETGREPNWTDGEPDVVYMGIPA
jgi:hypothetical protein